MSSVATAVAKAAAEAPSAPVRLAYGTAGFRSHERNLDAVMQRMGMLACLRACGTGKTIGVMITASHNPIEDNGVKMIDADGGMLEQSWEKYATMLSDAPAGEVAAVLARIAEAERIAWPPAAPAAPCVAVARDTRPSSERLCARCRAGAEAAGARTVDYGLLTTPQLHHIVRMANAGASGDAGEAALGAAYAGEAGYYAMLATAYVDVLAGAPANADARGPLVLDCANGIGGPKAAALAEAMTGLVDFRLRNTGSTAEEAALLNEGCGAEHAQKARLPPLGFTPGGDALVRCASLDGDADRLVYHTFTREGAWRLLDGDKIAVLAAVFIGKLLRGAGLAITGTPTHADRGHAVDDAGAGVGALRAAPVSVGIVQTAYANGASSDYIRARLRLPVVMAKTGVKFVHAAAHSFDVGVYFEANGHGTVLFHAAFLRRLRAELAHGADAVAAAYGAEGALALRRLEACSRLINQAIGDALSDALFVEAVLAVEGMGVGEWDALYEDLPSRQAKLAVADRTVITTTGDETRVTSPAALQDAIDALVAAVPSGRAFVRPSGTEDVVRVYAEAATQAAADALCRDGARAAHAIAGGVGAAP